MKIGVIVPMEEEIKLMKESLTDIQKDSVAGVDITIGTYKNHEVYLAQSGIGKVQAGMTATIMNDRYQPDFVVNTGSAGGIGTGLHIGDVVLSEKMAYHDVDAQVLAIKLVNYLNKTFISMQILIMSRKSPKLLKELV
jgi:5''-methylthioadenosine/S-adenosylhomocysteine nucleosidase